MSKKNIGATLALYPCPVIVVGAMVNSVCSTLGPILANCKGIWTAANRTVQPGILANCSRCIVHFDELRCFRPVSAVRKIKHKKIPCRNCEEVGDID